MGQPGWLAGQPQPSHTVRPATSLQHPASPRHFQFPTTTTQRGPYRAVLKHGPHCPSCPAATVTGRLQRTGRGQPGVCPS